MANQKTERVLEMSGMDWIALYQAAVLGFGVAGLILLFFLGNSFGFITLGLAVGATWRGLRTLENNPRHIGLYTIWGMRTDKLTGPGIKLLAPYFPLYIDIIPIRSGQKNNNFQFTSVRCRLKEEESATHQAPKSGGSVQVDLSITWEPDESDAIRVRALIDAGIPDERMPQPTGGLINIMRAKMAETLRQVGSQLDWESMIFGKERLSAILLARLTGIWPIKFKRNAEGVALREDGTMTLNRNEFVGERYYSSQELIREEVGPGTILDIQDYFEKATSDGYPDIHNLGIKVTLLNVEKVEPEGSLKADAELAAREQQQARKQKYEQLARLEVAGSLVEASKTLGMPINLERAFLILRIDEGKTGETVQRLLLEGDFKGLAEILQRILPTLTAGAGFAKGGRQ